MTVVFGCMCFTLFENTILGMLGVELLQDPCPKICIGATQLYLGCTPSYRRKTVVAVTAAAENPDRRANVLSPNQAKGNVQRNGPYYVSLATFCAVQLLLCDHASHRDSNMSSRG